MMKRCFPYFGFRYAWICKSQGAYEMILIDTKHKELMRKRSKRFPMRGYGFDWVESMTGTIEETH